jgi:bifunctional DNA-binding transcriptional regulator/antitoxin component of YhaV-PrlF toxin-antitoxin module
MAITTITKSSKGQVVILKEIRDELHWYTGHELTIETTTPAIAKIQR